MFLVLVVTDELRKFLVRARSGAAIRVIQVLIRDEQLVLGAYREPAQSWDRDYDNFLLPLLDEEEPCYILYRLDSQNAQGYEWLFISWSPDQSPVRLKMLYAATRATVKKEFGGGQVKDEMFGSVKEDICLQGYERHESSCCAPAPLTAAEKELQQIRLTEVSRTSMLTVEKTPIRKNNICTRHNVYNQCQYNNQSHFIFLLQGRVRQVSC